MGAGTCNDLQKRIDQWTQGMINDDDKMKAWVDEHIINGPYGWNDRYSRIPSEKEIALDELFGVK